ncbi:MAG TPA: FAD/NAD(P)-binding protein [Chloroflexota bacterium]|nr:FAD/NAD(P)-binding protein [Chloroflexota bacterium]
MSPARITVVGGGYSGTIQAIELLRQMDARVTLVERADRVARGAAYSTARPEHLLNVRAAKMSALADAPSHFADWLSSRGVGEAASFAPRCVYGAYLDELFAAAAAEAGDRLQIVRDQAVGITQTAQCEEVRLASGETLNSDLVILSIGNLPPNVPVALAADLPNGVYVPDPWGGDIAGGLTGKDQVLLIGTGLTAIDAALTLRASGFQGRIRGISRRGMVPRPHDRDVGGIPELREPPEGSLAEITRRVRSNARQIGWLAAVDQLRPHTQELWSSAPPERRKRFLRHLRPYWDMHRNRIAPEIGDRIEAMQREGQLSFEAGKLISITPTGRAARVVWRRRGEAETQEFSAARIVNCTGPRGDITRSGEPLLEELAAAGRIRPDPCRIGIDIDADCRVLAADGTPATSVYAIGPMTRGALWEIIAVADLRVQANRLASHLAGEARQ